MATETPEDLSEMNAPNRTGIQSLPLEVVHRALGFLDTDMLPAVRLTCKTLDSIVFARFAKTHFAHMYCWVCKPAAFRRLEDILQNSPSLRARIKHVTLTDNPFEDLPPSALHVVRQSNQSPDSNWSRVFMGYTLQQDGTIMTSAGLIMMQRVLRDLKELPQNVSVAVDLTRNGGYPGWWQEQHEHAFQATLFALAMSQTAVNSLIFDIRSLIHVNDILAHNRADLLASMSSVTSLTCLGAFWLYPYSSKLEVFTDLLQSMTRLRHLTFASNPPSDEEDYVGQDPWVLRIPREVWRAIDFSNLVSLDLRHIVLKVPEQDLSRIMAQCRSTLTHLTLRRVAVWPSDEWWKRVGELLLTMPGLVFVELQMIRMKAGFSYFWVEQVTTLSGGDPPGVSLEGRNDVVEGLQKLSHLGPAFFEQLR